MSRGLLMIRAAALRYFDAVTAINAHRQVSLMIVCLAYSLNPSLQEPGLVTALDALSDLQLHLQVMELWIIDL